MKAKKWTIYHWEDGTNHKAIGIVDVGGKDRRFGLMEKIGDEEKMGLYIIKATQNTLKCIKEHGEKCIKDDEIDIEYTMKKISGKDFPVIGISKDEARELGLTK